jgi:hypothetical protein
MLRSPTRREWASLVFLAYTAWLLTPTYLWRPPVTVVRYDPPWAIVLWLGVFSYLFVFATAGTTAARRLAESR